jgi:hypothetical protein
LGFVPEADIPGSGRLTPAAALHLC